MADPVMDQGAGAAPDDTQGSEQAPQDQSDELVVQIECHHAPDGSRTYFVGEAGGADESQEGAEGEEPGMKQVATLEEALSEAKLLLQGGSSAADAQAESEFAQGFNGQGAAPGGLQ